MEMNAASSLEDFVLLDWDDTLMPSSYLLSNIDYDERNQKTKIKTFSLKEKYNDNEIETKQFISNLEIVGNATFQLLQKIFLKFKGKNIKIVTNAKNGWLSDSLFIAESFCKIYTKIKNILKEKEIEIIYARDQRLNHIYWKKICFDQILWQYFNTKTNISLNNQNENNIHSNIITIGDQWTDHESISLSLTYSVYSDYINHHHIKLYEKADCRYLCNELKYISNIVDEEMLLNNQHKDNHDLILEFDGYNEL